MCGVLKRGHCFILSCVSVAKVQAGLPFFLLSALLTLIAYSSLIRSENSCMSIKPGQKLSGQSTSDLRLFTQWPSPCRDPLLCQSDAGKGFCEVAHLDVPAMGSQTYLGVKPKMHHISVLYDIFFSRYAHFSSRSYLSR